MSGRSRTETIETLAGVVAAIIGVAVVSVAPADVRPLAIIVLVVGYFLAFLVRGYLRRDRRDT